jgi:hypothetical protein
MCIEFGNTAHGQAIAEAAGTTFDPNHHTVISRSKGLKLLGGVTYSNYTQAAVYIHIAGFAPNWANRDILWVAFHYPFVQLNCSKLLGFVKSDNKHTLAIDYKLGFKYVTTIPGVFPDADLVVLALERDQCRWLKMKPRTLEG